MLRFLCLLGTVASAFGGTATWIESRACATSAAVATALTTGGSGMCQFAHRGVTPTGITICGECSSSTDVDKFFPSTRTLTGCSADCLSNLITLLCRYRCEATATTGTTHPAHTNICVNDLTSVYDKCNSCGILSTLADTTPFTSLSAWIASVNDRTVAPATAALKASATTKLEISSACTTTENVLSGRTATYSSDAAVAAIDSFAWEYKEDTVTDGTFATTTTTTTGNWVQASKVYRVGVKILLTTATTQAPIRATVKFLFPTSQQVAHQVEFTSSEFIYESDKYGVNTASTGKYFYITQATPTGSYRVVTEVVNTFGTYSDEAMSVAAPNDRLLTIARAAAPGSYEVCDPVANAAPNTGTLYTGSNLFEVQSALTQPIKCCHKTDDGLCTLFPGGASAVSGTLSVDNDARGFKLNGVAADITTATTGPYMADQDTTAELAALTPARTAPTPFLTFTDSASKITGGAGILTLEQGGITGNAASSLTILSGGALNLKQTNAPIVYTNIGAPQIGMSVVCSHGTVKVFDTAEPEITGNGKVSVGAANQAERCLVDRDAVGSKNFIVNSDMTEAFTVRSNYAAKMAGTAVVRQDPAVKAGVTVRKGVMRVDSLHSGDVNTATAAVGVKSHAAAPWNAGDVVVDPAAIVQTTHTKAAVQAETLLSSATAALECCGAICGDSITIKKDGLMFFELQSGVTAPAGTTYACAIKTKYATTSDRSDIATLLSSAVEFDHRAIIGWPATISSTDGMAIPAGSDDPVNPLVSEMATPTTDTVKLTVDTDGALVFKNVGATYSPVYVHGGININGQIRVTMATGQSDAAFSVFLLMFRTKEQNCHGLNFGTLHLENAAAFPNRDVALYCKSFSYGDTGTSDPVTNRDLNGYTYTGAFGPFSAAVAKRIGDPGFRDTVATPSTATAGTRNNGFSVLVMEVSANRHPSGTTTTQTNAGPFTSSQNYNLNYCNPTYASATALVNFITSTVAIPAGSTINIVSLTQQGSCYAATFTVSSANSAADADNTGAAIIGQASNVGTPLNTGLQVSSATVSAKSDAREEDDDSNEGLFGLFALLLIPIVLCVVICLVVKSKDRKASQQYEEDNMASAAHFSPAAVPGAPQSITQPTAYYPAQGPVDYSNPAPAYDYGAAAAYPTVA